jgi:hypothetical protein
MTDDVLKLLIDVMVLQARDIKARWYARVYYGARALQEVGGWAPRPGEKPRPDSDRVIELTWQLTRFGELIGYDPLLAESVYLGRMRLIVGVIAMRRKTGQYDTPWGLALRLVDVETYKRTDPTVDTTL